MQTDAPTLERIVLGHPSLSSLLESEIDRSGWQEYIERVTGDPAGYQCDNGRCQPSYEGPRGCVLNDIDSGCETCIMHNQECSVFEDYQREVLAATIPSGDDVSRFYGQYKAYGAQVNERLKDLPDKRMVQAVFQSEEASEVSLMQKRAFFVCIKKISKLRHTSAVLASRLEDVSLFAHGMDVQDPESEEYVELDDFWPEGSHDVLTVLSNLVGDLAAVEIV